MDDFEYTFPRPVQFRLGLSTIDAVAHRIHDSWPHVFQAILVEGPWHRAVRRWLPRFPRPLQSVVCRLFPRYRLPPTVVIKKLRDPFVEDNEVVSLEKQFANEMAMYDKLSALQGTRIPVLYGEGRCEGKRALVLSYLSGVQLLQQKEPRLTAEELDARIKLAYEDLARFQVVNGDPNPANIILEDDRVLLVDLEKVETVDAERLQRCITNDRKWLVKRYVRYLKSVENGLWNE